LSSNNHKNEGQRGQTPRQEVVRAIKDRYGFLFWLRWILWFAGSFIAAEVAWTAALQALFGRVAGPELTITWSVAVFGSWFLLLIPFMRKKEQIWKRLNDDQEKAVDAWLAGMATFIGLLIVSAFFWSWRFKSRLSGADGGMDTVWAKAVFGSWLAMLIPFLIVMYRQADRIFKTAEARQTYTPQFKSLFIDPSRRQLPQALADKIKKMPETLPQGHVVNLRLKGGRAIPHVFIFKAREVLGIYDAHSVDWAAQDIEDVEIVKTDNLSVYDENRWTRLDGKS